MLMKNLAVPGAVLAVSPLAKSAVALDRSAVPDPSLMKFRNGDRAGEALGNSGAPH